MMFPTTSAAKTKPGPAGARLRLAIALVSAFLVLVGQSVPGLAGPGGSDRAWIEICGDEGAEYALVDRGNSPEHDACIDCDCCQTGCGDQAVPVSAAGFGPAPADFGDAQGLAGSGIVPEAAEQYWAATRSPPEEEDSEDMTHSFVANSQDAVGPVAGMGETPCA